MGFLDRFFGRKNDKQASIEKALDSLLESEFADEGLAERNAGSQGKTDAENEDSWAEYEEGVVYADDGWPGVNSLEVLERDAEHIRFLVMPRSTFVIRDGVKLYTRMNDTERSITGFIKEWTFATPKDMELVGCTGFDFSDVPCMTETKVYRDTGATGLVFESFIVSGANLERAMSDVRAAISAYIASGLRSDFEKHAKDLLKTTPFDPAAVDFDPSKTKYENGSFVFKIQKRTAKKCAIPKIPLIIVGRCGHGKNALHVELHYSSTGKVDRAELNMQRHVKNGPSPVRVRCKAENGEFKAELVTLMDGDA